ncbi:MAG: Mandelate racemase/muconate lactonizing protein [Microbacterium sp.]|jgi:L-alanine-DL-glutamate epimerase-like enolase superfamily enzyme|nr:Mandelate racemase/muconate lactonizing protein [Microbacterium sp.]
MKISAFEVYAYSLTYAHGQYVMSGGRAASTQGSTLVRICTDDGLDGWGEVSPLAGTYLPTFTGAVRAALELVGPSLLGEDPTNLNRVHRILRSQLLGNEAAKSAIDIACWDLLGKRAGLPVAALLGGVLQEDFPLYEAVPLASPEEMVAFVERRRAAGITQFQLKVGNDPHDDARRTRAVVESVPKSVTVIADSNGGWNIPDAIAAVREMDDLPVYLEQPCRSTLDNAVVRRQTRLPLVLDESIVNLDDLVAAKYDAGAGSINIKLSRVGGITAAARMRDRAVDLGLSVSIEDTWGGDVTSAATSHIAASTAERDLLTTSFFNDWTVEKVADGPRSVNGRGSAPTGPGLGITVDVSALGAPLITF